MVRVLSSRGHFFVYRLLLLVRLDLRLFWPQIVVLLRGLLRSGDRRKIFLLVSERRRRVVDDQKLKMRIVGRLQRHLARAHLFLRFLAYNRVYAAFRRKYDESRLRPVATAARATRYDECKNMPSVVNLKAA